MTPESPAEPNTAKGFDTTANEHDVTEAVEPSAVNMPEAASAVTLEAADTHPGSSLTEETDGDSPVPDTRAVAEVLLNQIEAQEIREWRLRRTGLIVLICMIPLLPVVYLIMTGSVSNLRGRLFPPKSLSPMNQAARKRSMSTMVLLDPVARDLKQYVTVDIPRLAPLEKQAMTDYWETTGVHYTSDAVSARIIRAKVVPEYRAYINAVAALHPQTPEVTDLNDRILQISRQRMNAFLRIAASAGTNDATWKRDVAQMLANVSAENAALIQRTKYLIRQHPI